jgi:Holliday junction DNA helicase RuvA
MIARLTGVIAEIEANTVILDVHGVGYKVVVPVTTLSAMGESGAQATLQIHMHVREDEISLFGFSTPEQKKAFELLIGVSGIGPKVALSILSSMEVGTLAVSIAAEDIRTLTRVPGLGAKTAQRLVLELKDRMAVLAWERKAGQMASSAKKLPDEEYLQDVIDGLVGLGYNRGEAKRAAERAMLDLADKSNTAAALRAALNLLTGGK